MLRLARRTVELSRCLMGRQKDGKTVARLTESFMRIDKVSTCMLMMISCCPVKLDIGSKTVSGRHPNLVINSC